MRKLNYRKGKKIEGQKMSVNAKAIALMAKNGVIAEQPMTRHKMSITVPSTYGINKPLSSDVHNWIVDYVSGKFSELFNGCTVTRGSGMYVCDDGSLVSEDVTVVSTLCTVDEKSIERIRAIRDIAYLIKDLLSQESILFEVQEVSGYFI